MKKQANKVKSELVCKASASLNAAVDKELEEQDKSLEELLDDREQKCVQGKCSNGCREQQ